MEDFEKLGAFYLGRDWDSLSGKTTDLPFLIRSRDLTTHAVIVGMTGSGKTGLGISLLEEALIDNIPVIAIDPKGDLADLFLCFPELTAESLLPWVNPFEASQKGLSTEQFAAEQARLWDEGRSSWGQTPERARKLRESVDFRLYTPGGSAGRAVNVLGFLGSPPKALRQDSELLAARSRTAASALLGLLEIDSDPFSGRESVFLSNLLLHLWNLGRSADLGSLIAGIQEPPFKKLGFLDLEVTFPTKDRFRLAVRLNQLAAAPGFMAWGEGETPEAGRLFYGPGGRPRASIFSLSHLSSRERMFFVTLLLGELATWVRSQPGTSSLRALLYMDEVWGYLPPVQNPPSKEPLLFLLKQARAAGLGVVLSTQNPVDLDYKALSNAGTWFIGRLQTERDKDRLREGLRFLKMDEGGDREMDRQISSLSKRVFLHRSVHDPEPTLFHSRWTLSYLAGPLSREQMKRLDRPPQDLAEGLPEETDRRAAVSERLPERPVLPPGVDCFTVPADSGVRGAERRYVPKVIAAVEARYHRESMSVEHSVREVFTAPLEEGPLPVDWRKGEILPIDISDLEPGMPEKGELEVLPSVALGVPSYRTWGREFLKWFRQERPLVLFRSRRFRMVSDPGEGEDSFRARLGLKSREARDEALDKLTARYSSRLQTARGRVLRAEQALEREGEQAGQKKMETFLSFGTALASVILGRKISATSASRTATALTKAGRVRKEQEDVRRAAENLEMLRGRLTALEEELETRTSDLEEALDPAREPLEEVRLQARSGDLSLHVIGLAWVPCDKRQGMPDVPARKER